MGRAIPGYSAMNMWRAHKEALEAQEREQFRHQELAKQTAVISRKALHEYLDPVDSRIPKINPSHRDTHESRERFRLQNELRHKMPQG